MHFRKWLVLFAILLLPATGMMPTTGTEVSVTGHAQLDIQSECDSFSATTVASFTVEHAAACDENACKAASSQAVEKLAALFSSPEKMKKAVKPVSDCECSNGGTSRWAASCDELRGLARRLCYASAH